MTMAILQARMASTRLPGKVLKPLAGRPMLARQIERIRRARSLDGLVLATTDTASDDPVAALGRDLGIAVYRGSMDDVLDRYHHAARHAGPPPDHIVRLTGDCPLTDPALIDAIVAAHIAGGHDYTTNALQPTYPDGLDVEVLTRAALDQAWRQADLPSHREHVTSFIHGQPARFRIGHVKRTPDLSHLRWTVDAPEDYEFVAAVYDRLYPANPAFDTADILALLAREPALAALNAGHVRNAGQASAWRKDAAFLAAARAKDRS